MSRVEELSRSITPMQLKTHMRLPGGHEWMCDPLGFWHELSAIGKEAVRRVRKQGT